MNHILEHTKTTKGFTIALLTLMTIFCFCSCEGYRCANGTVIDFVTNLPLDSVLVEVTGGSEKIYTDSTGQFDICNSMGGCIPDCKDIIVKFSKNNYKTITLTNPEKGAVIRMEQ